MAGQWLHTVVENQSAVTAGASATVTITKDLPRSNFIGLAGFRIVTTTASATSSLSSVRILANGSAILWDTTGGQLRAINKYETGLSLMPAVKGITTYASYIQFGRFRRDEDVILPAKLFKSLQIVFTVVTGAATTGIVLDLWVEEYVSNDDPRLKRIKRITRVATIAAVAAAVTRQKLPLGNFLRAIYIHTDDMRNLGGASATDPSGSNLIRLLVNNGAEIPYSRNLIGLHDEMLVTYRFDDGTVPGGEANTIATNSFDTAGTGTIRTFKIDFDVAENLAKILDTSRMNELTVEFTAFTGATNNTDILLEEIIAVGA